jgi:hypothetical protein
VTAKDLAGRWWFWGGAALARAGVFWVGPEAARAVGRLVGTKGRRLTHATDEVFPEGDERAGELTGNILETPGELAAEASGLLGRDVSAAAYALARNIRSEEGNSGIEAQIAIAWVALNVAGGSDGLVALLTRSKSDAHAGRFGTQTGRWASTAKDPYEGDLAVAEGVLSGLFPDPTDGAIHYFRPSLQDLLLDAGKVSRSADEIDAAWGGEGFTVAGVDDQLVFYRRAG